MAGTYKRLAEGNWDWEITKGNSVVLDGRCGSAGDMHKLLRDYDFVNWELIK